MFELRVSPPRTVRYGLGAGGVALLVLVWWLVTMGPVETRLVSPVVLPSPGEVFSSFASLFNERALVQSIAATLKRVLLGFGLAILVGVPIGIAAFLFGFGAGAIAQVIVQLAPSLRDERGRTLHPGAVAGLVAGMSLMFATGLLVSM